VAIGCLLAAVASCWGRFDPLHPYELPDSVVTWEKYLGDGEDFGSAVRQTADGGYIVVGTTDIGGAGENDLLQLKTDEAGNVQWSRTFGGSKEDYGRFGLPTADGGDVLVGSTRSFGAGAKDAYLVKTDSSGIEQWSRTYGGTASDEGWCVQCTGDGGYIVTGLTSSLGAGNCDVYLVKTDSSGIEQWSRTFGQAYEDCGYSVRQTTDGGYIIAGLTEGLTEGEDNAYLIKTDSDGVLQWSQVFGGAELDSGTCVLQVAGGYLLVGYTHSFGAGDFDAWMIRTDDAGEEQWSRTYGGGAWDRADWVEPTSDGGYIVAGMSKSFNAWEQAWLIKTDDTGAEQWSRAFGGAGDEWAHSVQQTADGGYILVGSTNSLHAGDLDVYLVYYRP
jgi:hypothetical protein